ncbi:heme oxygenase-like protein [Dothidotthia symphoricarpi CBS 119687]|uniref:Heme oxygenase-like protein n=1 Tax=Dothidotthia symphoricarpi CBS 119687 TaxID=1392245 RepID=A0A6A6A825_9PLEO|nr:heme oxygenase-like protein [Dothidotthia symphoricarpi CBS 119687]KAF2126967.1 heme oxygenase-like protein [Dothidotthia symphoricarpi CBS 119687]
MLERCDSTTVSLPAEINTATRTLHTTLNRLITSRLPLALPPHASDPTLYATGLVHFAHIYLTFESLWADTIRDYTPHSEPTASSNSPLLSYLLVNPYDSPSLFTSTLGAPTQPSPLLAAFLQSLRPRGLVRSVRLKKDLEYLLDLHPTDLEVLLAKYPGDKVADFCTHIRKSVNEKPWTLVSYAWCFYMAVFSGGRWIRGGLLNAGPEFWPASDKVDLQQCGLSFWHFPGAHDGEDIKADFKTRLGAAEALFTPDERVDIIEEAKAIFHLCAGLVQELDELVGTDLSLAETNRRQPTPSEEKPPMNEKKAESVTRVGRISVPNDPLMRFLRRPELTGSIVALACLACVAFVRLQ